MLSVLIPTYNYNVVPLVNEINNQCLQANIAFEVLVLDDCSSFFFTENYSINTLDNCFYNVLNKNVGRSEIRNILAQKAHFNHVLFLDADVMPVNTNFIKNYLSEISKNNHFIVGGICYKKEKTTKNEYLRWYYGIKKESKSAINRIKNPFQNFASANFLINKDFFLNIQFNESLKKYGHEDTLFAFNCKQNNYKITHINNPVYHLGLDTNEIFIQKSLLSVENAWYLLQNQLIDSKYIKLLHFYKKIEQQTFLLKCIFIIGKNTEKILLKNLKSNKPNLKLLDFYKLYHLIKIAQND